jgi:hypothetical protein
MSYSTAYFLCFVFEYKLFLVLKLRRFTYDILPHFESCLAILFAEICPPLSLSLSVSSASSVGSSLECLGLERVRAFLPKIKEFLVPWIESKPKNIQKSSLPNKKIKKTNSFGVLGFFLGFYECQNLHGNQYLGEKHAPNRLKPLMKCYSLLALPPKSRKCSVLRVSSLWLDPPLSATLSF